MSLDQARRLAISGQRLLAPPVVVDSRSLTRLVEQIGYLQRDPLAAVAPSHLIVLWSRLGNFDTACLDEALWRERTLFEYWSHAASIVPTANLSAHRWAMRNYGRSDLLTDRRLRAWLSANRALRRRVLQQLDESGPLPARAFGGETRLPGQSTGWGRERDVERMLFDLWIRGNVAIAGRDGRGRIWDLASRWLGPVARTGALPGRSTEEMAVRSLRALGVGTEIQVRQYMGGGRHGQPAGVLNRLIRQGEVVAAVIDGPQGSLPGRWYVHPEDMAGEQQTGARFSTTLLSPFDNLIIARRRTELLFDFQFRMEIYVPAQRRQYGYYVLPILHHERLIGRADLRRDRGRGRLVVVAIHGEPHAPGGAQVGKSLRDALQRLARFVGTEEVEMGQLLSTPPGWARPLRS
ncbi:MAG: crosslink repair DNA glycosylase YcaQ family protein [Candidatus Dormiibacterota bacterium]